MFNGWECPRCHNIYAPNTPFCIFCWFQANSNIITNKPLEPVVVLEAHSNQTIPSTEVSDQLKSHIQTIETNNISQPPLSKEKIEINNNTYPDTKIYLMGIAHSKERAITRNIIVPYISDILQDFPLTPTQLVGKYFSYIKNNNIEYLFDSNLSQLIKNKRKPDIKEILRQYCFYINEFDIQYFFDFDCEKLLSNVEIEQLRKDLIAETKNVQFQFGIQL